jgi:hypothetical protein
MFLARDQPVDSPSRLLRRVSYQLYVASLNVRQLQNGLMPDHEFTVDTREELRLLRYHARTALKLIDQLRRLHAAT